MNKTRFQTIFVMMFSVLVVSCAQADVGQLFERYLWQKRVVLVFAPQREHPIFQQQVEALRDNEQALLERDIVQWVIVDHDFISVDGQHMPHLPASPLHDEFNVDYRDYAFILLGKDGEEKLRKDTLVEMEELFTVIDAMPMRKREMSGR